MSYRDWEVWKIAMDPADEIWDLTATFPDDERFVLVSQMRRAALSIPSNIAEGHGRMTPKDCRRHLRIANGSLKELETQLIFARRRKYLGDEWWHEKSPMVKSVGVMLRGLIRSKS